MGHNTAPSFYSQCFKDAMPLLFTGLLLSCSYLYAGAQQKGIQNAPVVQPAASAPNQLASALKTLSQRLNAAFVVEGQPLGIRSDKQPPSLLSTSSPEEAVKEVAEYYDYSAVRRGNVFLLTKLYTNPADVPEVTSDECRLSLEAVSKIASAFNPHFADGDRYSTPLVAGIARLLTPQQKEAMSHDGLAVVSLSPAQREEVWRIALHFYMESQAQEAEDMADVIGPLFKQDPQFHWQEVSGVTAFGYDYYSSHLQKGLFIPVSHTNKVQVGLNGATLKLGESTTNGIPDEDKDPTNPLPQMLDQAPPAVATTLARVATDLNAQSAPNMHCLVDSMLAMKRVIITGKEKATVSDILSAVSAVYGLRVIHRENGDLFLTRLRDPAAQDIAALGKTVRSVIPAPLVRAIHARLPQRQSSASSKQADFSSFRAYDYSDAARSLHTTALQNLRALAEAKVMAAKGKKLPLSQLGEDGKKLFAIQLVIGALTDALWLGERAIPPYIADFDHVVLTGGMYRNNDGENRFSLFFSYPKPGTGEMWKGVGVTNARLPAQ